jgi:hypothetical protein
MPCNYFSRDGTPCGGACDDGAPRCKKHAASGRGHRLCHKCQKAWTQRWTEGKEEFALCYICNYPSSAAARAGTTAHLRNFAELKEIAEAAAPAADAPDPRIPRAPAPKARAPEPPKDDGGSGGSGGPAPPDDLDEKSLNESEDDAYEALDILEGIFEALFAGVRKVKGFPPRPQEDSADQ